MDDLFITGNSLKGVSDFKVGMESKFEMSNLGKLNYISALKYFKEKMELKSRKKLMQEGSK